MKPERWLTHSLRRHPSGEAITRILAAALQAVDPYAAVQRALECGAPEGSAQEGDGKRLRVGGETLDLSRFKRIRLVGVGKAAAPMAEAAATVLGERLHSGLAVTKDGHLGNAAHTKGGDWIGRVEILQAGHPTPDRRSQRAARRMAEFVGDGRPDDLLLCLISGGGSALLSGPAEGITLEEISALTEELMRSGAAIQEINTVRKHIETLKGGKLARLAAPAQVRCLILSDVIGDPLDAIASGPAAPDESTFEQAWKVLERCDLLEKAPAAIVERLAQGRRGIIPETPKPGDPIFDAVRNVVIGNNRQAAEAALAQAQSEGFSTLLLTTFLQGEARQAGRFLAAIGRELATGGQPLARPACLIAGGETTVTVTGSGKGGRNQELALGAVAELAGLENIVLAALATDGGDGPTDAAGAVVSGETARRAARIALDPGAALRDNNAYPFFEALGDLFLSGPTHTNVNDLAFLFAL